MFTKENEQPKKTGNIETIIGPSVTVKGDFLGEGDVRVDGKVEGTLETKNNLTIGKGAEVTATVKARNIFVSGKVNGNIKAVEKMELSRTCQISGDIETKYLSVEEGAVFNGKCSMSETERKEEKIQEQGEIPPIR